MKIRVTHEFIYDTENSKLWNEFQEFQDDHALTFPALEAFITDRFINPNFDMGGTTQIEVLEDAPIEFDSIIETLADDLAELHKLGGLELDDWKSARSLVEKFYNTNVNTELVIGDKK